MIFKLCVVVALMNCVFAAVSFGQPAIEPGVPLELAKWRAVYYHDVRYKLNLTLEKMSPVLKGTMEIRVNVNGPSTWEGGRGVIVLDWRKIKGSEKLSTISNVTVNGTSVTLDPNFENFSTSKNTIEGKEKYFEANEHLVFYDGVRVAENVIKLDFTSPILTSGSAITRYVDKEDGAEYIYSLFVPSDASTAFPVFDQPDLKARFTVNLEGPGEWKFVSNAPADCTSGMVEGNQSSPSTSLSQERKIDPELAKALLRNLDLKKLGQGCGMSASNLGRAYAEFPETKPISTYVFAFAAGPFERVSEPGAIATGFRPAESKDTDTGPETSTTSSNSVTKNPVATAPGSDRTRSGSEPPALAGGTNAVANSPSGPVVQRPSNTTSTPPAYAGGSDRTPTSIYVRKSQAAKFKPHAAEVFRLNREGIKFLESYFDYKFPFPKYDVVLIPEFPFGGMEHAGATFLRESSVIFPQEPTKNDYISRANVIFHEAAHQWFGDTVTMKWFDDLWLKEGFAEFMAYKTLEKVMPEYNAWKVFYERNKQAAYLTDSTKGTTPIYQEIANLSAAKSAYGNIVYRKAPSFLRQAEFYLGPDKFQTAVRAFLNNHQYANAGWEDLVKEFETASGKGLGSWANLWIKQRGVPVVRLDRNEERSGINYGYRFGQGTELDKNSSWPISFNVLEVFDNGDRSFDRFDLPIYLPDNPSFASQMNDFRRSRPFLGTVRSHENRRTSFLFPNYQDYGYGIFLLDPKSRDYVLKNIGSEKDDFLRTMMWGSLWDSVREGELDPKEYVELVVKNLSVQSASFSSSSSSGKGQAKACTLNCGETDESTIQTLLGRVSTAMRYYLSEPPAVAGGLTRPITKSKSTNPRPQPPATAGGSDLQTRVENLLIDRMQNAATPGQRITYYRSFLGIASSENARRIMKEILKKSAAPGGSKGEPPASAGGQAPAAKSPAGQSNSGPPANAGGSPFSTKDKFDIVSRLIILGDPEAPKLLAELEKTETSDEAKRYAYAAKAGFATAENKAKFWNDFVNNKDISESWIEAAFGPFNNVRHSELTLPYLEKALAELPNLKRSRKIFFVNGWLGAFIGGQKSERALKIVNDFLAKNPRLDKDLRLKILENVDVIERAVKIRSQNRER
ncbi:MAG: M1 family aminopeptidase [Pyrinomonadaceae bacterium]